MSCAELFKSLGLTCKTLTAIDGNPVYCINTPFQYADGDGIHLYVEEVGEVMRFFDAGDTLFHVHGSGLRLSDKRSLRPLVKLIEDAGASMAEDGEISLSASSTDSRDAFRKIMTALLSVAGWEAENSGVLVDAISLTNEVEIYLREWKPNRPFLYEQPLGGISGREHKFSFSVDGELIDVVSSSPQATAAEVKKLADVRGIPSQADTAIRIVIDDRTYPERARQESLILSRFADVWPLTLLQKEVGTPLSRPS